MKGEKFTPEQRQRLGAHVARLYRDGYTFDAMGEALDVSPSTCAQYAQRLRLTRHKRRPIRVLRHEAPEKIVWREAVEEEPNYRKSRVVPLVEDWLEGYSTGAFPNVLAWHIDAAKAAGDGAWLLYVTDLLAKGLDSFAVLLLVLQDPEMRERAKSGQSLSARETRRLRAVK